MKKTYPVPARTYLQARWLSSKVLEPRRFRARQEKRTVVTEAGISYKPFDDTQSIFVHVPKCAGVSIARALYGNLAGSHASLDEYMRIFEPDAFLRYFKFTIVRNPWDRVVSAFSFLKSGGMTEADRRWAEGEIAAYSDFDTFVRRWLNGKNIWKWFHFRPQYHYVLDRFGVVGVDYTGRYENLEEDFDYISRRLGRSASLGSFNRTPRPPYSDFYCDSTKRIVADVYARDIAEFGYSFDELRSMPRLDIAGTHSGSRQPDV